MTPLQSCPSIDELSGLVDGKLEQDRAAAISAHLDQCGNCLETIARVETDGTLLADLQRCEGMFQFRNERPYERVREQVREIALDASVERGGPVTQHGGRNGTTETVSIDSPLQDTGVSHSPTSPLVPQHDLSSILRPPEAEGEIGRLGAYRAIKVLGAGGMGLVLEGLDPLLRRSVAIKIMKPEAASNPNVKQRFLREARCAASIDHDHIVKIYDVGEDRGVPFMVMPLLQGESLNDRLKRLGKLDQDQALRIGYEIALGLAAAHERGLIHRDIKPDNLWLDLERDRVKILDFGLARVDNDDAALTRTNVILGTPKYMSPEQAVGEPVDHRSDLFSLGSVLYVLLSGQPPFAGKSIPAVLIAVSKAEYEPIQQSVPDVDSRLAMLIDRLLSREPARRPQSAREVADELQATQEQSTGASLHSHSTLESTGTSNSHASVQAFNTWPRLLNKRVVACGVIGVSVLAATMFVTLRTMRANKLKLLANRLDSSEWAWSAPELLGSGVNTDLLEISPEISADDLELVFARDCNLYSARRSSVEGAFEPAIPLSELNSDQCEDAATFSLDRLTVIFASERNRDSLWWATRESLDVPFGKPTEIWPGIRENGVDVQTPHLTDDGLALFVTYGGDIAIARRESTADAFPVPVVLDGTVNTTEWESHPTLSADGSTLVFRSHRKGGFGDGDIWMSKTLGDDQFADPVNLGSQVNTPHLESGPNLSADGNTLYFMSNRSRPLGFDIFRSHLVRQNAHLQPDDSSVVLNASTSLPKADEQPEPNQLFRTEHSPILATSDAEILRLTNVIKKSPSRPNFVHERGLYYARLGRWEDCIQDYQQVLKLRPTASWAWIRLATALLMVGDEQEYQRLCLEMLEQFAGANSPVDADQVCKMCLLKPGAIEVSKIPKAFITLVETAVSDPKFRASRPYFVGNLALLAYRNGDAGQAIRLTDSIQVCRRPDALALAVRVMALHARGHSDDARQLLSVVRASMPRELRDSKTIRQSRDVPLAEQTVHHDWLICFFLLEECETLLGL